MSDLQSRKAGLNSGPPCKISLLFLPTKWRLVKNKLIDTLPLPSNRGVVMRKFQAFVAASLMMAISSPAAAQLVTNGSFETGDFTGWTVNAGATFVASGGFDGYPAEDGNYFAALGNVGGIGTVS